MKIPKCLTATSVSLFASVTLLAAPCAFGAESKRKHSAKSDTAASENDDKGESSDAGDAAPPHDSRTARKHRRAEVGLRAGEIIGGIPGAGIEAGTMVSSQLSFHLLFLQGNLDLKSSVADEPPVVIDKFSVTGRVIAAEARYFVGNSFYVTGGLGLRNLGFEIALSDTAKSGTVSAKAEAQSIIATIDIGNQWAWNSGFFLGCDWIGYSQPLSSSYHSSVETTGDASLALEDLTNTVQDAAKELGSIGAAQALVLDVGWLF